MGWLFNRKPGPVNPGEALAKIGHQQRRAKIRAVADQMRADMGLPPVEWPAL
ncbi:hypothetical protein [Novosphingobium sp. Leaf2]|uniref:hypothetical protein n=1 Tax=Novosphingobium sp. Leaf2 TaxID=1735670 RepID=UPI000AC5CF3E|nr:hypothetical protein [Novosphingobium sp. Leaf2]